MIKINSASMQVCVRYSEVFTDKVSHCVLFSFLAALLSELICTGLVISEKKKDQDTCDVGLETVGYIIHNTASDTRGLCF
jgi:hypothetical protein